MYASSQEADHGAARPSIANSQAIEIAQEREPIAALVGLR